MRVDIYCSFCNNSEQLLTPQQYGNYNKLNLHTMKYISDIFPHGAELLNYCIILNRILTYDLLIKAV